MLRLLLVILIIFPLIISCKNKVDEESVKTSPPVEAKQQEPGKEDKTADATPEIISIKFLPYSPMAGDAIKAEAATTGNVEGIEYLWSKNDNLLGESSDTLKVDIKRGDKITLAATPFNEKQRGRTINTFTYVFNSKPVIKSTFREASFKENTFYYQVRAFDADGDALTYSLKNAPAGMSVEPNTGLITWEKVVEDTSPPMRYGVVVKVSDGNGGEAEEIFYITLGQQ